MENQDEDQYICVGICMADPDSGYCLGCGRPPLGAPEIVAKQSSAQANQPIPVAIRTRRNESATPSFDPRP
jgi:predicted Fe-S protein YdhL (DUF1289 family)